MAILTETITLFQREIEVEVEYDYSYDEGVDRYSNGDPGYPPSEDLEVRDVTCDGESIMPILERIERIFEKEEKRVTVWEQIEELLDPKQAMSDAAEW